MKAKNLLEEILLEVFPHLPPLYMDSTLPMVCRSYRRLVGANIAKLPKHSVSIHNTDNLSHWISHSHYCIGWFSFDNGRKCVGLTKVKLKNLLVDPRLGRISRVELREGDDGSEELVTQLLTSSEKVPVITVAMTKDFGKHCQRAVEKFKPACLEFCWNVWMSLYDFSTYGFKHHCIFHMALPVECHSGYASYIFDNYNVAVGNKQAAFGKRWVFHFSHAMPYAGGTLGMRNFQRMLENDKSPSEQHAAACFVHAIATHFQELQQISFPEDLLFFCDNGASWDQQSIDKVWVKKLGKSKQPIRHVEGLLAEEIPGHNYYRRLVGCRWEVYWVSNPHLSSDTGNTDGGGGGGKCHLRVIRKVGGSDDVTLAVHFKVFDEAGKARWSRLNE